MSFKCQVCDGTASGIHFGADVCRACSAFFRRSVSRSHVYKCKSQGSCEIVSARRTMCKSCRFVKCTVIGMRKDCVQKNRDVYGKRPTITVTIPTSMPFLKKIAEMYTQLAMKRLTVYTQPRPTSPINFKHTTQVLLKEFHLLSDWIYDSFISYAALPKDQKDVLFRNFFFQFVVLEAGFRAGQHRRNDVWFMPSMDYIDCIDLSTFFHDPDELQPMSSEEAVKVFGSSFVVYHRNVSIPMINYEVDVVELLVLATLILFSTGVDGQSEECYEICRRMRELVQKEMLDYYEITKTSEEAPLRMGCILSMLPNIQRATRRFQEEIELRRVLKAYSVDRKFYDTCLGKF